MRVSSLLIAFIAFQPILNSITGYSIRYGWPSIVGPFFYFLFFVFTIIYLVLKKRSTTVVISISILVIYAMIMVFTGRVDQTNGTYLIKLSMPFILYLFVKNIKFNEAEYQKIIDHIIISVGLYAFFVILSYFLNYKIQEGKGYYGLIYAGNDMIALFILTLFFLSILKRKTIKSEILILVGFLLTLSKSFFLVILVYLFKFISRSKSIYGMILKSLFSIAALVGSFTYLIDSTVARLGRYLPNFYSASDLLLLDSHELVGVLTFGRTKYLEAAFITFKRSFFDFVFGLGLSKSSYILDGKVGIEMDFFDALNAYGFIGVVYLVFFFYVPIFRYDFKFASILLFLMLLFYSFFGGHFYNNPLVGVYYGIILGLLGNVNQVAMRRSFESCLDN